MVRLETVKGGSKGKTSKATSKSNKENTNSLGVWEADPYDEEQELDLDTLSYVPTTKSKPNALKKASGRLLTTAKPSPVPFGEHKSSTSTNKETSLSKSVKVEKFLPEPSKRKSSLNDLEKRNFKKQEDVDENNEAHKNKNTNSNYENEKNLTAGTKKTCVLEPPARKLSLKDQTTVPTKTNNIDSKSYVEPKRKASLQNKINTVATAAICISAHTDKVVEEGEKKRKASLKDKKSCSGSNKSENESSNSDPKRKTSLTATATTAKSLEASVKSTGSGLRALKISSTSATAVVEFVKPLDKKATSSNKVGNGNENVSSKATKRSKENENGSPTTIDTNKVQKLVNESSSSRSGVRSSSSFPSSLDSLPLFSYSSRVPVTADEKKAKIRKIVMKSRLQVLISRDMVLLVARYLPGLELVRLGLVSTQFQTWFGDPNHRLWQDLCVAAVRKFRVPKREEDSWRRRYCQSLAICEACEFYASNRAAVVACICCSAQYCGFNPPAGHVRFPSTPSVGPVAPRKLGMCYEQCWTLCWRCNDLIVMQNQKGQTGAVCRVCCPPDRDVCEQCRETILLARTKPQWQTRRDEHKVARVLGLSDTMGEFVMEFEDDNRSVTSQARYERPTLEESILETSTIFDPYY